MIFTTRLHGDGQHEPALMLRCVAVARPEQDGEDGEDQRDDEIRRLRQSRGARRRRRKKDCNRLRHRLELQGDVGKDAGDGHKRHDGGDGGVLAIARGNKIRDRGNILRLRQLNDAAQQGNRERKRDDRPQIDRDEVESLRRGGADAAEKCP
jgi:hypothetical protein